MGLMDKLKGALGKEEEDNGERDLREAERDQEERDRRNDELLERVERRQQQEEKADTRQQAQEDFQEKAESRDTFQQEFEEAIKEAKEVKRQQDREESRQSADEDTGEEKKAEKEETERERIVRERKERIEDLKYERESAGFRPKVKTAQELRTEELQLKELESKYTRTGQLKSRAKDTAKGFLKGDKTGKTDRMSGVAGRATKAIRGVSTLGGAVHISKARKGFYVPKMDKSLYGASGMQELTRPEPRGAIHTSALRRAGTPSYERLRQSTIPHTKQATTVQPRGIQTPTSPVARMSSRTPTHLAKPMGFIKVGSQAQDIALERLRGLSFPTGLTTTEKLAYAEIKANHDIDTKSHVVSELMDLGIDKMEALRSVEGLMQRRVVKRGQSFEGESTLRIT